MPLGNNNLGPLYMRHMLCSTPCLQPATWAPTLCSNTHSSHMRPVRSLNPSADPSASMKPRPTFGTAAQLLDMFSTVALFCNSYDARARC